CASCSLPCSAFRSVVRLSDRTKSPPMLRNRVVFGILSQNTGCVIFREFHKASGMFWGVAVTTKTTSKLEVVETQNYTLEQKKWDEGSQDDDNELQRIAVKDKVKFVKIPNKKPTETQLQKARALCKESS